MDVLECEGDLVSRALSLPKGLKIRTATLSDLEQMASVTRQSWQLAFAPFLPNEVLQRGTQAFFEELWRAILKDRTKHVSQVIVKGSSIVACGASGGYRGEHNPHSDQVALYKAGELYRGYVLPKYQNLGLGQAMLKMRLLKLYEQGYLRAYTWIYAKNTRARRFYEKHGAVQLDSALGMTMNKFPFAEVCYGIEVNRVFDFK